MPGPAAQYYGPPPLPPRPGVTPAVRSLLIANIAVFFAQELLRLPLREWFALWPDAFMHGRIWQLFTYMFLHGGAMHLFFNMLILYMLGPETERGMGRRHFLIMYLSSGVLGGLGWVLLTSGHVPCVGASGAVFGIIGAFGTLYAQRVITVLVFFILPVTTRAWIMAASLGAIELLFVIFQREGTVAHGVHVAGGLAGSLYALIVFRPEVARRLFRFRFRRRPRLTVLEGGGGEAPDHREVDRILDKIAREGMSSLSRQERDLLGRASREHRSGR